MSPTGILGYLEWNFGFHDNDAAGWLITASYLVTAVLCFAAGRAAAHRAGGAARSRYDRDAEASCEEVRRRITDRVQVFWYILAVVLVLLGVNKQLNLQSLLTVVGRNVAKAGGWYARRREVQEDFLIGLAVAGAATLAFFGWLIRRAFLRQVFALAGVLTLVCFVVLRAASIEHVDQMLGLDMGGVQVHFLLEFGGILIIAMTAAVNIARRKSS